MKLKHVIVVLSALLLSVLLFSCAVRRTDKSVGQEPEIAKSAVTDSVYMMADILPRFPQGTYLEWIGEHIKYPLGAVKNKIQGKTYIQTVIEKDGRVSNVKVLRSSGNRQLDDEGIRVISSMPAWIPGEKDGKKVRVSFTFPINFALTK